MANPATLTEADILMDVVAPQVGDLPPEAAQALLTLYFNPTATARIRKLLHKNNRGTIKAEERLALDKYLRVGQFLDLVHAKARLSLGNTGSR